VHGKVANDCEMEQIVQLDSGLQAEFASYVQTRGSIPTYWYQETSVTNPKPPILVDRIDPNYLATQVCLSILHDVAMLR
jgi:phosphatidylinositol 3,5-bisphosphate 5-phosphatase